MKGKIDYSLLLGCQQNSAAATVATGAAVEATAGAAERNAVGIIVVYFSGVDTRIVLH